MKQQTNLFVVKNVLTCIETKENIMRCQSCDKNLSDYECSLRNAIDNTYVDMCCECITESGIKVRGNTKLSNTPPPDNITYKSIADDYIDASDWLDGFEGKDIEAQLSYKEYCEQR